MAFVDELTLAISAGTGGSGVVRWRHEKGIDRGGPAGGDGGRGGSVYVVGRRNLHSLSHYKHQTEFQAEHGADGMRRSLHGKSGEDLTLEFPLGTVITNKETGERISIEEEGVPILLLEGGRGGLGNEHFKSSTNRSPKEWTPGKPGAAGVFDIELELFANLGLIGLPNAGKTSLLNALTQSKGAVAAYPFTTLEPNLGDFHGFILADIPGLIEGASEGRGLGHKFLRHIRRTKELAHLISLEEADPEAAYATVRDELGRYDAALLEKPEIIILTKADAVGERAAEAVRAALKKKHTGDIHIVSLYDDASLKRFSEELSRSLATLR